MLKPIQDDKVINAMAQHLIDVYGHYKEYKILAMLSNDKQAMWISQAKGVLEVIDAFGYHKD